MLMVLSRLWYSHLEHVLFLWRSCSRFDFEDAQLKLLDEGEQ